MELLKKYTFLSSWSTLGLILAGGYLLLAFYWSVTIVSCSPNYIGCNYWWFVLSLPLSIMFLTVFGKLTPAMYISAFVISSFFYVITLYQAGKIIEQWRLKQRILR